MDWIELGRIRAPFGIKGWLHVESHTDPPERLLGYREWALRLASGERLTRKVAEGRRHAAGLVAHLEGVDDRGEAATLNGAVMVTRVAGGPEHWVPAAPPHLQRVDLAAGVILVDWPAELK